MANKNTKKTKVVTDDIHIENEDINKVNDIVDEKPAKVIDKPVSKKKPYINNRGLIKIKIIKPGYSMIVGATYEKMAHIADNLVRSGNAEYVEFIEG